MSLPTKAEQLEEYAFDTLGMSDEEFGDFLSSYLVGQKVVVSHYQVPFVSLPNTFQVTEVQIVNRPETIRESGGFDVTVLAT